MNIIPVSESIEPLNNNSIIANDTSNAFVKSGGIPSNHIPVCRDGFIAQIGARNDYSPRRIPSLTEESIHNGKTLSKYNYVKMTSDMKKLNIVGILLGGSMLYKQELGKLENPKDWDGIILVKQKNDIVTLVNEYRQELCNLLDIKYEEYPELRVPSPVSNLFETFHGVRFVGRTHNNIKKGTKILTVDHLTKILQESQPSFINLLSFKEVRVAEYQINDTVNQVQIQQATRLDDNLVILHDADIFLTDSCKRHDTVAAIFGATTDLLMTGSWVYDDGSLTGEYIARNLFLKYQKLHTASLGQSEFMPVFKNTRIFPEFFRKDLERRFKGYYSDLKIKRNGKCRENLIRRQYCFWGQQPEVNLMRVEQRFKTQALQDVDSTVLNLRQHYSTNFSSNSQNGSCETNSKIFWKMTKFLSEELEGCKLVSQYYHFTQIPLMVDLKKHVIFYPFFDGTLLANLRLECVKREFENYQSLDPIILTVELQRCEDLLRAFCVSAKMEKEELIPGIHRFFYNRIMKDTRFDEFYQNGISYFGKKLTLQDLKSKDLLINGRFYGNLTKIMNKASQLLHPSNFQNQIVVCGMGDGHSGNVMVGKEKQKNETYRYIHIDYEVAGFHSPILDLAKPFYNDIFFNLFYSDLVTSNEELFDRHMVKVDLDSKNNIIKIELSLPKSLISSSIFEIKKRYLLLPFFKFVKNCEDLQLNDDWVNTFGQALFCCALLTRNFSKRPDVFFGNLALGVILTSIRSINDLDDIVKVLPQ